MTALASVNVPLHHSIHPPHRTAKAMEQYFRGIVGFMASLQ
jgi:hypothetical protein